MPAPKKIVEHWILNLAIEGTRKLSDFLPVVKGMYLNVRDVPGCGANEYAEALLRLFDAGMLRLYFDISQEEQIEPDRRSIEAVIARRLQLPPTSRMSVRKGSRPPRAITVAEPDLLMELTESGGCAWETLAEPNWNLYAQSLTDIPHPKSDVLTGEVWSANQDLLLAQLGWFQEINSGIIDRKTIRIEVLHDHLVTYWKRLPQVYRATFSCSLSEERWGKINEPKWFRDWWGREWYRHPWQLQEWPRVTSGEAVDTD